MYHSILLLFCLLRLLLLNDYVSTEAPLIQCCLARVVLVPSRVYRHISDYQLLILSALEKKQNPLTVFFDPLGVPFCTLLGCYVVLALGGRTGLGELPNHDVLMNAGDAMFRWKAKSS